MHIYILSVSSESYKIWGRGWLTPFPGILNCEILKQYICTEKYSGHSLEKNRLIPYERKVNPFGKVS